MIRHLTMKSGAGLTITVLCLGLGITCQKETEFVPCRNCGGSSDHTIHKRQLLGQCNYPCKCSNKEIRCKGGVNIIRDGCECCYMCARQQGDLCNYRDKCDEDKGMYCDFQKKSADFGICRAKEGKSCEVDGLTYKDGEEFKPSCNRLCSCQNGNYACTSLCPQEDRQPSSVHVHCREPQLVAITGRCCKEWVCPHSNSLPHTEDEFAPPTSCQFDSSWTACSVSCGIGVSFKLSYNNGYCMPTEEKRLCIIHPCGTHSPHYGEENCPKSWKQETPTRLQYNGCTSVKEYRPKYCATCKRSRCCVPEKTKTNAMEWECDGKLVVHDFMWIKSCVCTDDCP